MGPTEFGGGVRCRCEGGGIPGIGIDPGGGVKWRCEGGGAAIACIEPGGGVGLRIEGGGAMGCMGPVGSGCHSCGTVGGLTMFEPPAWVMFFGVRVGVARSSMRSSSYAGLSPGAAGGADAEGSGGFARIDADGTGT